MSFVKIFIEVKTEDKSILKKILDLLKKIPNLTILDIESRKTQDEIECGCEKSW